MLVSLRSVLRGIIIPFALSVGFLSCTDHNEEITRIAGGDNASVTIKIHTPSSVLPSATRNAAADESLVSKVKIIVLEDNGSGYRYEYMVDGQQITSAGSNTTSFNALLKSSTVPLKLYIIANYNDAFDNAGLMANMSDLQVRTALSDTFLSEIKGNLPIYGEATLPNLDAEKPNTINVTMLRAVARVDVLNKIDTDFSENFSIESVHIYRANDKLRLVPDQVAMSTAGGGLSVTAASIPSASSKRPAYYTEIENGASDIEQVYLPESLPVFSSGNRVSDATCVVVGGIYGNDAEPSYYRIDFDSGLDGHPFGQVLRNHKYIFNILQINGTGWETPGEAANNEASLLIAEMQIWDEVTSEMYYCGSGNYLGISSRLVVLEYPKGSEETIYLKSNLPFSVYIAEGGGPVARSGSTISKVGEFIENDFFRVTIQKDMNDPEDRYMLVITALSDNLSAEMLTDYFYVYNEFWQFDVTVMQKTYHETYSSRDINVLTIVELPGDLGHSDGTMHSLSGDGMRMVLENPANFSPSGTVPVKSIIVHSFSNAMLTNDTGLSILEKMLGHVDVVHLPSDCTPSVAAARMIWDWAVDNERTVLIIGLDNPQTNANIVPYITDNDKWRPGENEIEGLGTAFEEDVNVSFFYGPFGDIVQGEMGLISGNMCYNNGYDGGILDPILIVYRGDDSFQKATHLVDKDRGIFYFGESEIFSSRGQAMSPEAKNSGTVTSEFDKLMGNIWAWIAEKVITGRQL